jgi:hypothetical protein
MLAPIVDIQDNAFLGVHQTFLAPDGAGKAAVDRIAEREGWTKVAISPGVVCVPESEVAATIEKRIAEAKTGQLVSAQRAISKLGIAARRRNRAARKVIAPEADRGDPP